MSLRNTISIIRHLGPGWALFRLGYAARRRMGGLVRAAPVTPWREPAEVNAQRPRLFRPIDGVGEACVEEAENVIRGRFPLFSHRWVDAGDRPEWNRNALTGELVPADRHWSQLGDFAFGDIKGVWELSRFSWAFTLARAYARTRDDRFAERFWRLLEDWMAANPPNRGPNWMCGQEATFRLFAIAFAADVCAGSGATTSVRVRRWESLVDATGHRIASNLDYALSQKNNHGVSECVGLITAGLLRPAAAEAENWKRTGLTALAAQLAELVYDDGGFAQHSVVYHRVLLHDLLFCQCAMRAAGASVPAWLTEAGARATKFLGALVTEETGAVPLYGPNDGANVLPLADGGFLDFRSTLQASAVAFLGEHRLSPGPWDEMTGWLAGSRGLPNTATGASVEPRSHFRDAGCFIWKSGETRLFLRCPTRFRHRPAQADLLHIDLEWRGQPVTHDAGTFSYNARGAFGGAFKSAAVHNTLTFDGDEPMRKAGRFLYLPWPKGEAGWNGEGVFHATHDGWKGRGLSHQREISSPQSGHFVVRDSVGAAANPHRVRLHWLLADLPHTYEPEKRRLLMRTPKGEFLVTWSEGQASLVRADQHTDRGWWSPYYHHVEPALSLAIELTFSANAQLETTFSPA